MHAKDSDNYKDNGISFVVVGDFGWADDNFRTANTVFDHINEMKQNAELDTIEDFDFFVTTGDNLYPKTPAEPTQEELDTMVELFEKREAISDLPIYPVRGNHDCYFKDQRAEIELNRRHPTWKMTDHYYEKSFKVGLNGEKFSLLQLDSCYLLCVVIGKASTQERRRIL